MVLKQFKKFTSESVNCVFESCYEISATVMKSMLIPVRYDLPVTAYPRDVGALAGAASDEHVPIDRLHGILLSILIF
jgi:hypothetical protein